MNSCSDLGGVTEMLTHASDAFAEACEANKNRRTMDAKLYLAAGIALLCRERKIRPPVVTGGTTVDFFAAETLESAPQEGPALRPSLDLDFITLAPDPMGNAEDVRIALSEAGFQPASRLTKDGPRRERGWMHPDVPIPVEILSAGFHGDVDHLAKVDVDGVEVVLRGAEDTLYEHVEWGAHARDQRSWTRALAIANAQRERLDVAYLRSIAVKGGFAAALESCLRGEPLP